MQALISSETLLPPGLRFSDGSKVKAVFTSVGWSQSSTVSDLANNTMKNGFNMITMFDLEYVHFISFDPLSQCKYEQLVWLNI